MSTLSTDLDQNYPTFVLPKGVFDTNSSNEVQSYHEIKRAYDDLVDKNLHDPPFDKFKVLSYHILSIDLNTSRLHTVIFDGVSKNRDGGISCAARIIVQMTKGTVLLYWDKCTQTVMFSFYEGSELKENYKAPDKHIEFFNQAVMTAYVPLITLLSFGVEQRTVTRLLPKQGTSAQRRKAPDRYATEIHLEFTPELKRIISERSETTNKGSGGTKSPHMRRGFIKTQRYGPKLSKVKEIFIEAVHVNKDKGPSTPKQTYRFRVTDQNQGLTV